jgi:lipid-binding SYLF domain-containing protein
MRTVRAMKRGAWPGIAAILAGLGLNGAARVLAEEAARPDTADSVAGAIPESAEEEAERAAKAAVVLTDMVTGEDRDIPLEILQHADAVAVIPNVVKGAFMIGGRHGKGLVSQRNGDRWSPPVFVEIGGASFGFQIGVESTDLILVFTEKKGLQAMLEDKIKLGADVAVAAGPVGREGAVGANATFDTPIYSYSRSKGVFAGISLEGAILDVDDDATKRAYGKSHPAGKLLSGTLPAASKVTEPFLLALQKHVPGKAVD